MSRTRKDRPDWVRANDPTERRVAYHRQYNIGRSEGPTCWNGCSIEEKNTGKRKYWDCPCFYCPDDSMVRGDGPSNEDLRNLVHGPTRAVERVYTRAAANYYNTYGSQWDGVVAEMNDAIPVIGRDTRGWWY